MKGLIIPVHYEKEFTTNDTEIIEESFQATLEIPDINSVTVEWHDDKNTISLPATFSPAADENYRYRVSLFDQSGNVLSSYTGSDGSVSLDAPLNAEEITVTYEALYDTGKHEVIYSTEKLSETLLLEAPKILLSDEKTLIDIGYYAIEYGITTRLDEFEIYENFSVVINGVDHSPSFSPAKQSIARFTGVPFFSSSFNTSAISSVVVSTTLSAFKYATSFTLS